ncbi:MAG: hypothetical protein ACI97A_001420 [Planctomycetota bacterium]|jgi:hypothetical protein
MPINNYEKLGAFYLGKIFNMESGSITNDQVLYDAKDLTTHAVCVGMTGSGKTGLCVTLIEEAAIDGIPAIVVDLKGDLVNLMLAFPEMRPEDLLPWVEPAEATRKGMTVEEFAHSRSELWRNGLKKWDQDLSRIGRYKDSVDFTVYTPGSNIGHPLTILKSFAAPATEILADREALQGRISASVSGLLALMGVDADPITSREFILLASILKTAWTQGQDVDLGTLIRQIQAPPFESVGFFDLDTFYPAPDRLALAMKVNNLVASPGFESWMEGETLDVGRLLWTKTGKPRISILSLAHLDDAERMFFMTSLLNEVNSWMRTQAGSSSLRALLYIDEVFGYLPPTANPPSKKPMLTLLKQARAFGLGLVLATQNPVDLDYKALSNAGTWFLGRLQTERDKMRVLEGLEGAASTNGATFNRAKMEQTLAGLDSRVFVMNNVHDDEPIVFHTRWALSFLRGPVTGDQIRLLTKAKKETEPVVTRVAAATPTPLKTEPKVEAQRGALPAGIEEKFVIADRVARSDEKLVYRPALFGKASLHYVAARAGIDLWRDAALIGLLGSGGSSDPWSEATPTVDLELDTVAEEGATFEKIPPRARQKKNYTSWKTGLKNHLYREMPMKSWKCAKPRAASKPGEIEGDFVARIKGLTDEKRDLAMEKLKKRYAKKIQVMKNKLNRAEDKVEREKSQYKQQKTSTAISFGATILGALFGRKVASAGNVGRAASSMRGVGRSARERGDVKRAEENMEDVVEQLKELEAEFEESLAELQDQFAESEAEIVEVPVRPRKGDLAIKEVSFVWTPWIVNSSGIAEPAFTIPDED